MMRRLLTIIIIVWTFGLFAQSKIYLVSVGVADYPGTNNDLRISDNDAKTIANVFMATKEAYVDVLVNEEATQSAVLSSMHTLFTDANSNDAVILYFSGHGTPGTLMCYDGSLNYLHIFKMLKGCKASRKIIIADACYSGKMRTAKRYTDDYSSQSIMLFLSSRTNEQSKETPYQNSLFTIFLERGLRGGADINENRIITARELFDFVHQGVVEVSAGKQHPVMWGKFDDNMTIIKW